MLLRSTGCKEVAANLLRPSYLAPVSLLSPFSLICPSCEELPVFASVEIEALSSYSAQTATPRAVVLTKQA
jgi:hypothetical protein